MYRKYSLELSNKERCDLISRIDKGTGQLAHDNTEMTDPFILRDYPDISKKIKGLAIAYVNDKYKEYRKHHSLDTLEDYVDIYLTKSWGVRYGADHKEDSFEHHHDYANLSFVFYPRKPKGSGDLIFTSFGKTRHAVATTEEEILLFDSHMTHLVEPNGSGKERYAIAGDLMVTLNSFDDGRIVVDHLPPVHAWERL